LKTAFIINPRAKKGLGVLYWFRLEGELLRRFPRARYFFPGDTHQLDDILGVLSQQGFERLILVGGDGTVNRVVNRLFSQFPSFLAQLRIGILPLGTGNDWVRNFGFTKNFRTNLDILAANRVEAVDVGKVQCVGPDGALKQSYFLNMLTMGLSVLAVEAMNASTSSAVFSYMGALVQKMTKFHPYPVKIHGKKGLLFEGNILNICIANGKYVGGGIPLLPQAKQNDGLFHCLVVQPMPIYKQMAILPFLLLGKHLFKEKVEFTSDFLTIEARDLSIDFETDGELPGSLPITVECVPRAIQIIVR